MKIELKNKKQLINYLANYSVKIEKALIFKLEVAIANLQNHAKQSAEYKDQTSNLKSSIGGVVLKNGKPISYKGFSGTDEGTKTGLEFINSLISNFSRGYTIILVAGMEYATYVENYVGLNVLEKTKLKAVGDINKAVRELKATIK